MSQAKKIGPSFVAAVAITSAAVALAAGCSGSREPGDDQAASAHVVSADLVISQVYGGGGNTSAPYANDFVEIFNRGSAAVSLNGKSLQYATFSGNFSNASNVINLPNVSVDPGKYFLVKLASGGAVGSAVTGDATGATNIAAGNGKIALVETASLLSGCGATNTACTPGGWIDMIGYGTASQAEGSAAPGGSNTQALIRKGNGCSDTGNNSVDFNLGTPTPRNSTTAAVDCGSVVVDSGTATDSATQTDTGAPSGSVLLNEVKVNPGGTTDSPWEYAEILCTPSASLDGYYFVAMEGDADSAQGSPGQADIVVDLSGKTCGANGIAYIKAAAGGAAPLSAQSTVITTTALDTGSSPFENATTSFIIIHSPTTAITQATDYDTNNDGTLELPGGASVVDGVATFDQSDGAVDWAYAPKLIIANGSPPDGLVRRPGDSTAMSADAWYYGDLAGTTGDGVDFDTSKPLGPDFPSDGAMTPGAPNVGSGSPITDGGTTTDSGTKVDSGTKTDGGTKTDSGTTEEPPPEDDGGTTGGTLSDGGKKDASKGTSSSSGSGTTTPPSSGGCAIGPEGTSDLGFIANALAALGAIVALSRRKRSKR